MPIVYYDREEFELFLALYVWDTPLKWKHLGYILGEHTYVIWQPQTASRIVVRSTIVGKTRYSYNQMFEEESIEHFSESDDRAKNSIRAWLEKWDPSGYWYSASKGTRTYRLPRWKHSLAKKFDKLRVGVGLVGGASAVPEEAWTWARQKSAKPAHLLTPLDVCWMWN